MACPTKTALCGFDSEVLLPTRRVTAATAMEELERHRRSLAVARELPGDHATPAHVKRQAVAIVAAIDRCANVGELAQWLLDAHPELADVLPLSSVQRIFLAGRGSPAGPPVVTTAAHLTPTLSFNALCRARTTLDDFSHFYLCLLYTSPSPRDSR